MDKKSIKVGIIETWTILAIVLHFCDVGYFAKWPVIDWPWHWSCCCLILWEWIVAFVLLLVFIVMKNKERRRKLEKCIEWLESHGRNEEAEMLKKEFERMRK